MTNRSQKIPTRSIEQAIAGPIASQMPQLKPTERIDNDAAEDEQ